MTDSKPDHGDPKAPGRSCSWVQRGILATTCALVIGVYAYMAHPGVPLSGSLSAADNYYNLLVQGFRAGQLSLKREVPPGFLRLADPYNPTANMPYRYGPDRLHDLSYYKGRLYLYFGVTPALILFWPFVALTGHYLSHRLAVLVFCTIGFLASMGVLYAAWRRYFSELSMWVVAACALALGLATGVPVMLPQSSVYEVAISCGYMLTLLSLGAIWRALHESRKRSGWLSAASLAYGLALGARPSLLFGAVILLIPVIQAWRERRPIWVMLIAAAGPILLIGLGLMLYNALRFGSPLEFGLHYQLAVERQAARQLFSLRYLWFNFRVYFLEPVRWGACLPFVHEAAVPPLPQGHYEVEGAYGVLTNIPLVWLALGVPLAWRGRTGHEASTLRWFVMAMALLLGICALTVGLLFAAVYRYEVEFLPVLLLLAVMGILGLERTLAPTSESGRADRLAWRRVARWGWCLLLSFSVAFNLFASVGHYAEAHGDLGIALAQTGKIEEAIAHYQQALRINPDFVEAHYNLGLALVQQGRLQEAISHWEQALRLKPDFAEAHYNLGLALVQQSRLQEAISHWEQALRLKPDLAEAHYNLGLALEQTGRVQEAIQHYEQALRINPDYAVAHYNLGVALEQAGRMPEAIQHYEQALRIKPDFVEAQNAVARARAAQ